MLQIAIHLFVCSMPNSDAFDGYGWLSLKLIGNSVLEVLPGQCGHQKWPHWQQSCA